MVILRVYSLEDSKEEQPLSTFSEGKHVIGRGLLGIHINPCFFIAAQGKTITTLSQGTSGVVLNDGDKFSFLPSDYWFKIRYDKEDGDYETLLNRELSVETSNEAKSKRSSLEDRSPKRLKVSEENEPGSTTDFLNQEFDIPDEQENIQNVEPNPDTSTLRNENNGNTGDDTNIMPEIKDEKKDEVCDSNVFGENTSEVTSTDVKTEADANEDDNITGSLTKDSNEAAPAIADSSSPKEEVKNESRDDTDKPSCSTDNQKTKSRRERCWYGMNCYRKNGLHRDDFSHPGDSDFESDPEDDRPVCPFGGACYRRNLLHRRQYKHANQPAPKPSKGRVSVRVSTGCPFCAHCRGYTSYRKPDYESDYDSDSY